MPRLWNTPTHSYLVNSKLGVFRSIFQSILAKRSSEVTQRFGIFAVQKTIQSSTSIHL